MNLRFVEAYYWVVSLKSVSRAAEKLFITQSAMSSRIAALEEELGVLLLDRRDKQFRLTVAGMRFFNHAQRLLALQREIKGEMGGAPTHCGAGLFGLPGGGGELVLAARDQQDARSFLAEHPRRFAADPSAGTGDDTAPSLQPKFHALRRPNSCAGPRTAPP